MNTALKIITPEDLQGAGAILATTQSWVAAYQKKRDVLIAAADKEGVKLTPATDAAINDYLASLRKAATTAEEQRKPYTAKLNEVIKLFTTEEARLKELATDLQNRRNISVAAYAKDEAEQRKADQLKLDHEKERITLFADAEQQIRTQYADLLRKDKGELTAIYEAATLEDLPRLEEFYKQVVGTFQQEYWDGINATLFSDLLPDECHAIAERAKEGKFEKVAPHYQSEIKAYADHLLSLLPERRKELEAGAAESAAAAKLREEQEKAEEAQAEARRLQAERDLQNQTASAVVDMQISQANRSLSTPKAQKIESYSITVEDRAGWAEIFKFYFTHSDEQDLGKIKLDQMKAFAERKAKSDGLKIESPSITYTEVYKAVTKSKKAA